MANGQSTWAKALDDAKTSRAVQPSADEIQLERRVARFRINVLGGHSNNDYYDLGPLLMPGTRVIPEQSRIRFGGTGTVNFKVQLAKVDKNGGNTQLLSAATAAIEALTAAIPLVASVGGDTGAVLPDDRLRLVVTDATALPNTVIILLEVAYDVRGR